MTASHACVLMTLLLVGAADAGLAAEVLSGLAKQIAETREQYFSLYNQLNSIPRYEMVCRDRLGEPSCKPRFLLEAQQKGRTMCPASSAFTADYIADVCNPALDRLKAATAAEEAEYLKHVARVVEEHPQLLAIGARLKRLLALQRAAQD